MKIKQIALLIVGGLLVTLISWPRANMAAQEISSENLFTNPGFEAGYYNKNSIPQIAVPNNWNMWWLDNVPFEGSEGQPAYRPETVVWNIQDAPANERSLFFRDGSFTLKIFKGYAPMYAALSQDVSGLETGRNYRLVVPIFVDIVESYSGGSKVGPYRNDSGFVRFGVAPVGATWLDASQINYSPYWTAENVQPFYQTMPIFVWDFTASAENMTIWIEVGSRHAYQNNGFFMDGLGLYALDSSPAAPSQPAAPVGPPPTPGPTATPRADGAVIHVVSSGDSMWTIAIKYAATLGMTPEAALPYIQELNNNPAFISVGQELIIIAPNANPPVVEEPTAEPTAEPEVEETPAPEPEAVAEETAVEPEAISEIATTSNAICITVFNDANSDGRQDTASEGLQSNAAITLFRGGNTVSTYITDGISEPFCFENLEPDTYQVQMFAPADYVPTTADNWAVSVSNGASLAVGFGVAQNSAPVEVVDTGTSDTTAETAPESTNTTVVNSEDDGGFLSSVAGIILVVAVVLILILGAGVMLLRRG